MTEAISGPGAPNGLLVVPVDALLGEPVGRSASICTNQHRTLDGVGAVADIVAGPPHLRELACW